MDLRFTPEENAFRDEVRTFFKENLPDNIRRKAAEGIRYVKDDIVTWQRILNQKGWAVPHWPKEWGGTGWSPVQLYIFKEEMQQAPAPEPLPFGTMMLAPVLLAYGREDLDDFGAIRRLDLLPLPHRHECEEAGGHHLHSGRHEDAGRDGAADPD